jgi:hypothetical protein
MLSLLEITILNLDKDLDKDTKIYKNKRNIMKNVITELKERDLKGLLPYENHYIVYYIFNKGSFYDKFNMINNKVIIKFTITDDENDIMKISYFKKYNLIVLYRPKRRLIHVIELKYFNQEFIDKLIKLSKKHDLERKLNKGG